MPTIKEYREFFLRNIKVVSGLKKDQESNYPLQYIANIGGTFKKVYNRFLKGNVPSEDVYRKLFESITFKLNPEDTATVISQGLVTIAELSEVKQGLSKDSSNFALVINPNLYKQLTERSFLLDTLTYTSTGSTLDELIKSVTIPKEIITSGTDYSSYLKGLAIIQLKQLSNATLREIMIQLNNAVITDVTYNSINAETFIIEFEVYKKGNDMLSISKSIATVLNNSKVEVSILQNISNNIPLPLNIIVNSNNPETDSFKLLMLDLKVNKVW